MLFTNRGSSSSLRTINYVNNVIVRESDGWDGGVLLWSIVQSCGVPGMALSKTHCVYQLFRRRPIITLFISDALSVNLRQ